MAEPRQIAVVRDHDELHAALAARADELRVTRETLDAVSGLQSGYSAKLLAPFPSKKLNRVSLGSMLGALGLMLIVVEDVEAFQRVEERLMPARGKPTAYVSRKTLRQLREMASKGGHMRAEKLHPRWRRAIARKGGKAYALKLKLAKQLERERGALQENQSSGITRERNTENKLATAIRPQRSEDQFDGDSQEQAKPTTSPIRLQSKGRTPK